LSSGKTEVTALKLSHFIAFMKIEYSVIWRAATSPFSFSLQRL
jgi:hypothetical protein